MCLHVLPILDRSESTTMPVPSEDGAILTMPTPSEGEVACSFYWKGESLLSVVGCTISLVEALSGSVLIVST